MSNRRANPSADYFRRRCLVLFFLGSLCAAPALAQFPTDPINAVLLPQGAKAAGTATLAETSPGSGIWRFTFVESGANPETLIYEVDTATLDPQNRDVRHGLVKIREVTLDVWPVTAGGMRYRDSSNIVHDPIGLAQIGGTIVTSITATTTGANPSLAIAYRDTALAKSRQTIFTMYGRALRVRCSQTGSLSTAYTSNYCGLSIGAMSAQACKDVRLPFMVSTPLAMVTGTGSTKAYVTTQVDWSASNGSSFTQVEVKQSNGHAYSGIVDNSGDPTNLANSYEISYEKASNGQQNRSVDETFWVMVTRKFGETFAETTAEVSPYKSILNSRPVVFLTDIGAGRGQSINPLAPPPQQQEPPTTFQHYWNGWAEWLQLMAVGGMTQYAAYFQAWWSTPQTIPLSGQNEWDYAESSTANWQSPFVWKTPAEFPEIMNYARNLGIPTGMYVLYTVPQSPTDPSYNISDQLWEVPYISPVTPPLLARKYNIAAHAMTQHFTSDMDALQNYTYVDPNSGATESKPIYPGLMFGDVYGGLHPGIPNAPGSPTTLNLVDGESGNSTKAKSIGEALRHVREFYSTFHSKVAGPSMAEGSWVSTNGCWHQLYAGALDAQEGSIDTGRTFETIEAHPSGDLSPTNWWVLPDYALLSANRHQVRFGFGDERRFLPVVPNAEVAIPFNRATLAKFMAYGVTYGHAHGPRTKGPLDGFEDLNPHDGIRDTNPLGAASGYPNFTRFVDFFREYYMMHALQEDYLASTATSIQYWNGSAFKTADELLQSSTLANPMKEFLDPKIKITYASGLVIWVNHATSSWTVNAIAGENFEIPEDGFVAWNPNTSLLVFSARPTTTNPVAAPIDYARALRRFKMFDGRGVVSTYDGLTSATNGLVVINQLKSLRLDQSSIGEIQASVLQDPYGGNIPAPSVTSMALVPSTATLSVGQAVRLVPRATYSNTATLEFPYLTSAASAFSSSNPAVATVDAAGVVRGVSAGTAVISFTGSPIQVPTTTVTVQ